MNHNTNKNLQLSLVEDFYFYSILNCNIKQYTIVYFSYRRSVIYICLCRLLDVLYIIEKELFHLTY